MSFLISVRGIHCYIPFQPRSQSVFLSGIDRNAVLPIFRYTLIPDIPQGKIKILFVTPSAERQGVTGHQFVAHKVLFVILAAVRNHQLC